MATRLRRDHVDRAVSTKKLDNLNKVFERRVAARTQALARANDDLVERGAFLKQILDTSSVAIFVVDTEGRITQTNQRMAEMFGWPLDALTGTEYLALVHPAERDIVRQKMLALLASAMTSVELEQLYWRSDQTEFWGHLTGRRFYDANGEERGLVGVIADITVRKQAEEALKESEERWKFALEGANDGVWDWNFKTGEVLYSKRWKEMFGFAECEIGNTTSEWLNRVHPEDLSGVRAIIERHLYSKTPSPSIEYRMACKDGSWKWTLGRGMVVSRNSEGKPLRVVGTNTDITERKQAELALLKSKQQYDNLASKIPVGIYILRSTPEGTFTLDYASPRMAEMFNLSVNSLRADVQAMFQVIHPDDLDGFAKLNRDGIQQRRPFDWKGRVLIEGAVKWLHIESSPEPQENGDVLWHGLITDITESKQMEDQVRQLALHDTLTTLPNRRLLNDRLSQTMAASTRSGCYGALMFLDLDNFKPLNDTHGHAVGDLLLIEAADRLKSCVREMDTVARFGGDEFVVMLSYLSADKAESTSQAEIVAEKLRTILSEPYLLTISHDGKEDATVEHHCTASIGVVVFINHEGSQDDILKWADTAMYEAKEAGRNIIRFYHSED